MAVLTRDERRKRVLDLHNQGMGTREIAKLLHMSFTDIAKILKDADKEKESEQQRTRQEFLSSKAYKLFSEGKTPVQVAIDLNIRASEAIIFQREYWELEGLHNLNRIYEEIKGDDIWQLANLWKSVKTAGMGVPHVLTLLKVANNDLPTLEYRYVRLKQEVNSLQEQKRNLYNQVTEESNSLGYYRVASQREIANFEVLHNRRIKEEALVRRFQSNNSEYVKINKFVEEKVRDTLSNRKAILKLAALCLTESIKQNPEKYSYLVQQNTSSTIDYTISDFNPFYMYGQRSPQQPIQSKVYFIEDYVAMLLEDADKLFGELVKKLGDEVISGYTVSTSTSLSLPVFFTSNEDSRTDEGAGVV